MRSELRRAYAAIISDEITDPRAEGPLIQALSDSGDPVVHRGQPGMRSRSRVEVG